MAKYIDADRLKAEMEKRMHICDGVFERDSDTYYQGKAVAYQETLSFIDSLQQEQPSKDLEKEFQEFCKDYPFPWSSAYINAEYIEELCKGVAKHFYELGNRSHWKPSEEQIECLRKTLAKETGYERTILRSLFQELITLL